MTDESIGVTRPPYGVVGFWFGDCPKCSRYAPQYVFVAGPHRQAQCRYCSAFIKNIKKTDVVPLLPDKTEVPVADQPMPKTSLSSFAKLAAHLASHWLANSDDTSDQAIDKAIELGERFAFKFLSRPLDGGGGGMTPSICKGCGKKIYWARNPDTKKQVPLDLVPVYSYGEVAGGGLECDLIPKEEKRGYAINHFLTCPFANDFRKKKEVSE